MYDIQKYNLSPHKTSVSYALLSCAREFLELRNTIEEDLIRSVAPSGTSSGLPQSVRPGMSAVSPQVPPLSSGTGRSGFPPGGTPSPGGGRGSTAAQSSAAGMGERSIELMKGASQRLVSALEHYLELISIRAPYISQQIARDAQFALAGFADESLLHHPSGRLVGWHNCLVEEAMFGTRTAGELFFSKLNEIFYNVNNENMPLLVLHLAVLRMGFLGRFRGVRERSELDRLRANALARVMELTKYDPAIQTSISPTAYESTITTASVMKMPFRGQWRTFFLICIALSLIVGSFGWYQIVASIDNQLQSLLVTLQSS